MQLLSAFSRPQTVPDAPATAPRKSLWILDSWRDLILYVGTPLLLVPVFALAQTRWRPQDIYLFVAAFGAMGHHLPGMIRAYGDRALFERFKWRFVLAPLFLLAVCVAFFWWDLKGILLVVFFWGVWHGLMQTYGFCRIYDAKAGTFDSLTRRLDFAMCVIWFATAVALSPYRLSDTLDTYYMCGGPFIPPSFIQHGQQLILFAAITVSVLFLAHVGMQTVKRILPGVVTASTLLHFYYDGFIWKVRERSTRQSLGLAGGTADVSLGGILPSWAWHGFKWVAVFVVPLSALWFWQTHLMVPELQRRAWLVADVPGGAKQHFDYGVALQKEGRWEDAEEQYKSALHFNPADPKSHMDLAVVLTAQAKFDAAVPHMEEALHLQPNNGEFHFNYASLLQRLGRGDEAGPHYEAAARLLPDSPEAHYNHALFLASGGNGNDAIKELQRAVQLKPDHVDAQLKLADALFAKGDLEEARMHYVSALGADPKLAVAHNSLGRLYLTQGQISQAIVQFGEALRLNPDYKEAEENLRVAKASDAQVLRQTHN